MRPTRINLEGLSIQKGLLTKRHRQIIEKHGGTVPGWMVKMVGEKKRELARLSEPGANFLVGQNKVYLPDFVIALMRTPHLPPSQAQFRVPLHFTKLDLRDYLFHAYDVRIHGVRSWVDGPKVNPRKDNPDTVSVVQAIKERGDKRPSMRMLRDSKLQKEGEEADWSEAQLRKYMVVELEKPFIWPPKPTEEDLDELVGGQASRFRAVRKRLDEISRNRRDEVLEKETEELLSKQAAALRQGKVLWRGNEDLEHREIQGQVTRIEPARAARA